MTEHSRRGLAAMEPDKQRQIAEKGARAAHDKGTAHEFTSDEAREAGRQGGQRLSHPPPPRLSTYSLSCKLIATR